MKNVRILLHAFSIFFLISCAPSIPSVNAFQTEMSGKPAWVSNKPISSFDYVGIGYSQKRTSENYIQSSKQNALDDLISEIRVSISSVSVVNQIDNSEGFTEQYKSMIKTTASDDVEGYELIDTWEDENQYWVYYRLSKDKYKRYKADKRKNAVNLASDNFIRANKQIESGKIANALALYISGFYNMAPYLGESDKILIDGDSLLLANALYNKVQDTFNDLMITSEQDEYLVNRRLHNDATVNVMVKTKSGNDKVRDFPLIAKFSSGAGNVSPEYSTNNNGVATILVSSIRSKQAKQTITVMPDIDKLILSEGEKKKYQILLNRLLLPQKELHFQIQRPVVYLTSTEKKLGELTNSTLITDKVKKILSEEGFILGRIKDKADLLIEVTANTEKGKSSGSIFITYFNLNLNVIDLTNGAEIHHGIIDRLKAYSLNYERSSQSGYDKAIEVLESQTMPQLIEEILQ